MIMKCVWPEHSQARFHLVSTMPCARAEAIFTVTHICRPVKLPPTQEMTWNRWSSELAVCLAPWVMLVGYEYWLIMSPNKRLSDKLEVKTREKARCSQGPSERAMLAVQTELMNEVPGKQCPLGLGLFTPQAPRQGRERTGEARSRCSSQILTAVNASENILLESPLSDRRDHFCTTWAIKPIHGCVCRPCSVGPSFDFS